mgnify:CR=1 FL=1
MNTSLNGLALNETTIDALGNNIANAGTNGFKTSNVRFQTLFRPAAHVSGDLYDVMRLDESHVGFYMADAVGRSVASAVPRALR